MNRANHQTAAAAAAAAPAPRGAASAHGVERIHERATELCQLLIDDRQRTSMTDVRRFGWLLAAIGLMGLAASFWGTSSPWARVRLSHPEIAQLFGVAALVAAWMVLRRGHVQPWMRYGFAIALAAAALASSALNGIHGLLMVPLAILVVHHGRRRRSRWACRRCRCWAWAYLRSWPRWMPPYLGGASSVRAW